MTQGSDERMIQRLGAVRAADAPGALGVGVDFEAVAAEAGRRGRRRMALISSGGAVVAVLALVVGTAVWTWRPVDGRRAEASAASGAGTSSPTSSTGAPSSVTLGVTELVAVATVLEAGDGPRLCLGGVRESYPPQCSGPLITGWDWAKVPPFEAAAGVRWGSYAVVGTFDGTSLTVTRPVTSPDQAPAAAPPPTVPPQSAAGVSEERLVQIQDALNRRWSEIGLLTSVISMAPKHLEVLVTFDDGRLQRDLDATYGPGVVLVRSALRPLAKG